MHSIPKDAPSRRARVILYLVGVAALAVPWGYLLFVRPWLRAHRSPIALSMYTIARRHRPNGNAR